MLPLIGIGALVFYTIGLLMAYDLMATDDRYEKHHRDEDGGDWVILALSLLSWAKAIPLWVHCYFRNKAPSAA